jgi:hypothetical protein
LGYNCAMPTIREEARRRYQLYPAASHMTHIDNLPAICAAGALISYNRMRGSAYFNLANEDVQSGRAGIMVPATPTPRPLHDFVPLYFGFKTPMVAVNQKFNEELLFLTFPLDVLGIAGAFLTDGNARSGSTRFVAYQTLADLAAVDAKAANSVKYAHDPELKRRKQAEILIPDQLPLTWLQGIVCYSPATQRRAIDILQKAGINKSVMVNPGWYFTPRAP